MTTKEDFSEQEWDQLLQAPMSAGLLVMAADMHITSMLGEMKGMMEGMVKQDVPQAAEELVKALIDDIRAKSENKEKLEPPDIKGKEAEVVKADLLDQLAGVSAIVDAHCSAEEARGFKQWIVGVAQHTAEAGREGGFLGIGSVRVSDKEKDQIEQIKRTLDLT